MSGRPRKPTAKHDLEGTRPGATARDRANEPTDLPALGDPPEHWLSPDIDPEVSAQLLAIWSEVKHSMPEGVITEGDRHHVEIVVGLMWRWRFQPVVRGKGEDATELPSPGFGGLSGTELSTLNSMLGKLGMNPSERSKVGVTPRGGEKKGDGWDEL